MKWTAWLAQLLLVGIVLGWVGSASALVDDVAELPEPGTLWLLGSGLVGLAGAGWIRYRRK
jgi:hypothetical protein